VHFLVIVVNNTVRQNLIISKHHAYSGKAVRKFTAQL